MAKSGTGARGKRSPKQDKRTQEEVVNSIKFESYIDKLAKNKRVSCQGKTVKMLSEMLKYTLLRLTAYSNDAACYSQGQTLNAQAVRSALKTMVPVTIRNDVVDAGDNAVSKLLYKEVV